MQDGFLDSLGALQQHVLHVRHLVLCAGSPDINAHASERVFNAAWSATLMKVHGGVVSEWIRSGGDNGIRHFYSPYVSSSLS